VAVRILVVDDEAELLQLIRVLLSRIGAETLVARDAASAKGLLSKPPLPNLLILDLMLPGVGGMEFLRELRSRTAYDDLPVLILSASIDPTQIREALDAGADRYLTKPYVANNLISIVQQMMASGRRAQTS